MLKSLKGSWGVPARRTKGTDRRLATKSRGQNIEKKAKSFQQSNREPDRPGNHQCSPSQTKFGSPLPSRCSRSLSSYEHKRLPPDTQPIYDPTIAWKRLRNVTAPPS